MPCKAAKLILPENKILIAVYEDGVVKFWDLKEATNNFFQLNSTCLQLAALDVHPTQHLAAIGCKDGRIVIINTITYKLMETFGEIIEVSYFIRNLSSFF